MVSGAAPSLNCKTTEAKDTLVPLTYSAPDRSSMYSLDIHTLGFSISVTAFGYPPFGDRRRCWCSSRALNCWPQNLHRRKTRGRPPARPAIRLWAARIQASVNTCGLRSAFTAPIRPGFRRGMIRKGVPLTISTHENTAYQTQNRPGLGLRTFVAAYPAVCWHTSMSRGTRSKRFGSTFASWPTSTGGLFGRVASSAI
jgi:hypothetical protein